MSELLKEEPQDVSAMQLAIPEDLEVEPMYTADELDIVRQTAFDDVKKTANSFEDEDVAVDKLVDSLLAETDKFDKVFRTDQGSVYFVTKDGASMRVKLTARGILKIQPILSKLVFIPQSEVDRILQTTTDQMFDQPFTTCGYEVGATPLELGLRDGPPLDIEEDEHSISFKERPVGWHIGHPVGEIVQ